MFNMFLNKRICPKCHEKISKAENKCSFCGEDINVDVNDTPLSKDSNIIVKCVIACIIVMICFSFISRQLQIMHYKYLRAQIEKKRINGEYKQNYTIEEAVTSINKFWGTSFIIKNVHKYDVKLEDAKISDVENYIIESTENYKKIGEHEYQCTETEFTKGNISFKFTSDETIKFTDNTTGDVAIYKFIDGKLIK